MLVSTTNELPGQEIVEVLGEVMGLTVRSRNIGSQLGASFKSILGGELKGMTKALVDSRQEVMQRMIEEAEAKGADAIVAMRDGLELDGDLRLWDGRADAARLTAKIERVMRARRATGKRIKSGGR
jgi:uncharacterized protein YbjQ (UPF0145 family)